MRKFHRYTVLIFLVISFLLVGSVSAEQFPRPPRAPEGFVYVTDVIPDVILDIRYYSTYNFLGTRVDMYLDPVAILEVRVAERLKLAADKFRELGYVIKIFDTYRPQGAVDHFMRWGADTADQKTKQYFYPDLDKATQIDPNVSNVYIASTSSHSRGTVVDFTLVNMKTGKELNVGSKFDHFGRISDHRYGTGVNNWPVNEQPIITQEQKDNRAFLRQTMVDFGFSVYNAEWWHYSVAFTPTLPIRSFPNELPLVTSWP